MSTEEQDRIHGRLLRERRESGQRMAAIIAKVKDASASLTRGVLALDMLARGQAGHAEASDAASGLAGIPGRDLLLAIVQEYAEERDKLHEIEVQLERFGA